MAKANTTPIAQMLHLKAWRLLEAMALQKTVHYGKDHIQPRSLKMTKSFKSNLASEQTFGKHLPRLPNGQAMSNQLVKKLRPLLRAEALAQRMKAPKVQS